MTVSGRGCFGHSGTWRPDRARGLFDSFARSWLAAGFEADVGGDVAASVAEVAGLGVRVASVGFSQVFQDEARSAQLADKLVPAVHVLDGAGLSV